MPNKKQREKNKQRKAEEAKNTQENQISTVGNNEVHKGEESKNHSGK